MPFIGQNPSVGAYNVLDNITIGSNTNGPFNMLLNGAAFFPESANHLLVSLNGVIQKPGSSFTVSGSQITFVTSSGTLTTSDSIDFIMALGNVLDVGTPTDGSVSTNKIATNAVTGAKIAPTITTNHTFSGANIFSGTTTVPAATSGWRHIKTQVGNGSSTIDFLHGTNGVIFDNTYDVYEFVVHYMYLSTSTDEFQIHPFITDVGGLGASELTMTSGAYQSGGSMTDYNIVQNNMGIYHSGVNAGDSDDEPISGKLRVYYPYESSFVTVCIGEWGGNVAAGKLFVEQSYGNQGGYGRTYGMQFKGANGNIYAKISLYGLKDS